MIHVAQRSLIAAAVLSGLATMAPAETRVIHVSVDGFGPTYFQPRIDANLLPNMKRFQTEGAWTNNARTDHDYSITLPNHTTQMTGRGVVGAAGHNYVNNSDPAVGVTLQTNKGSYVASVFDVAHDNALRTSMFVGKSKFSLYDTSYNSTNGALDTTGADNGRDKIDAYSNAGTASPVVSAFIANSTMTAASYSFLHFADPDNAGHSSGWGSSTYNTALTSVDTALGQLFNFVTSNSNYVGNTYIVLTADHGGGGGSSTDHSDATNALNYTIPFWVWGPDVLNGDLYALNGSSRVDPGSSRIAYNAAMQPIRNGDAANLELGFFDLASVPGSTINSSQNLAVPEPSSLLLFAVGGAGLLLRNRRDRDGR